eukprot:COSAG02_NODE_229_length_28128_cov_18.529131_11_plen_158_part_00
MAHLLHKYVAMGTLLEYVEFGATVPRDIDSTGRPALAGCPRVVRSPLRHGSTLDAPSSLPVSTEIVSGDCDIRWNRAPIRRAGAATVTRPASPVRPPAPETSCDISNRNHIRFRVSHFGQLVDDDYPRVEKLDFTFHFFSIACMISQHRLPIDLRFQ